ncbi:MAG TPA: nuclear transport factor 2 family protein [Streptosporangiaceae bacterium]|nr:nuclear transport factor 2 family protein [Streptosporangiaceae bacterium]
MRTFITRRRLAVATLTGLASTAIAPAAARADQAGTAGDAASRSRARLERNKRTVVGFYDLAFNQKRPQEAVRRFAGPMYIQHNPLFADGTDAFIAAVTAFTEQNPQLHVDIRTVIAEGDRVLTHSLITLSPDDLGLVAADIFRIERGRIVEHWDVVQPFPETSVNDHPMF